MSFLNEEINSDINLETQFHQQLLDEPMNNLDKYLINQTQQFNKQDIDVQDSRAILVKLIYLVNQGIYLSEQEVEILFFRITKLFISNNWRLRLMCYKLIKIIILQKYEHIIIQSLCKDLVSNNQYIKVEALKFIPFIYSEQYVEKVEGFVHNAILDTNLLISSTALIVGIRLINKFPNLVCKWLFEVAQRLDEPRENLNYHALILLHEIKKTNLTQFIKIIILLTQRKLEPLLELQIIKFIKEILPSTKNPLKKELINYLFQQVQSRDPLKVFESAKVLLDNLELQNDDLLPINQFIEEHMNPQTNYLLLFSSLKFMLNLLDNQIRSQLITAQQMVNINALAFHFRIPIASLCILLVIKLNQRNAVLQLKYLYDKVSQTICKLNFLQGIREIVIYNPTYNQIILEFIKIINLVESQNELVYYAIQIIDAMLQDQKENLDVYSILIQLTITRSIDFQYYAIKILNQKYLSFQTPKMEFETIKLWFRYLQLHDLSKMNDFQFNFMRQQFDKLEKLQLELKNYYGKKIVIMNNQDDSSKNNAI